MEKVRMQFTKSRFPMQNPLQGAPDYWVIPPQTSSRIPATMTSTPAPYGLSRAAQCQRTQGRQPALPEEVVSLAHVRVPDLCSITRLCAHTCLPTTYIHFLEFIFRYTTLHYTSQRLRYLCTTLCTILSD